MARVTNTEVQELVPTEEDCTQYITVANLIVTEELDNAGLSTDRLKQIELYLSAHFAVVTLERGGLQRQKIGDADDTYKAQSWDDRGFMSTRFGQQAVTLDPTGKLGAMTKAAVKAEFRVV